MIEEGMYDTVAWAKTAPDSNFSGIKVGYLICLDFNKKTTPTIVSSELSQYHLLSLDLA